MDALPPERLPATRSPRGPATLAEIHRPGARIAIWPRRLPPGLAPGLAILAARAPWSAVVEGTPEACLAGLTRRLPSTARPALRADLLLLAKAFLAVSGEATLRLRLEAFRGPGCHRWHADAVGLRLLMTYVGPGTEWLDLPGGAARARALDPDALPVPVQRLRRGQVAILKGEAHPGNAGNACIHRSPPNAEDSPPRLLLCLDEPGRIPLP
jgi:hypothetical protein